jgi:AbrB family looped-hinge helix DNA binding protein
MNTATMTSKGQLTIPKEVRDALHLEPGNKVEFHLSKDGKVTMYPRNRDVRTLRGMVKIRPGLHASIEEINETIADAWAGVRKKKA